MINSNHVHVVINTHNRLPLIRETIPRIISAIKSDGITKITHTIYDDTSDAKTIRYLLKLKQDNLIDNLILGSGNIAEYKEKAQKDNPFIANYLQVLRACLFIAPAKWILHFTDDALIEFNDFSLEWLRVWIYLMENVPEIMAIQMTDHERNVLYEYVPKVRISLPEDMKLFRINFVSDRYNFYRTTDLVDAFEQVIRYGNYPLSFEVNLNNYFKVNDPVSGRFPILCQWDSKYVATHIGSTGENIRFTSGLVKDLAKKLKSEQRSLTLSERTEFR